MAPPPKNSDKKLSSLTYSKYLKVDELLRLQQPLSEPMAHDEMLFILIHQVYELWFKLILFETRTLIQKLDVDDVISCYRLLDRICEILKVLVQQIDILETMSPVEFNVFRTHLNPASGFQSLQFRELEILSGLPIKEFDYLHALEPEWKNRVQELGGERSLKKAFAELLIRKELITSEAELGKGISEIYSEQCEPELHNLCEQLLTYDELFSLWRFRHVQMVERMIGMKKGTGGSLGVFYLQSTLKRRFFPELWEVRTELGSGAY